MLYGDRAARHRRADLDHTAVGLATHAEATVFWATAFEIALELQPPRSANDLLGRAASICVLAAAVHAGLGAGPVEDFDGGRLRRNGGRVRGRGLAPKGMFDAPLPDWIKPCIPTLVDAPPAGPLWIHEIKWDGHRVSAYLAFGTPTIRTRK